MNNIKDAVIIDAGVDTVKIFFLSNGEIKEKKLFKSNVDLNYKFNQKEYGIILKYSNIFITGKLSRVVYRIIKKGVVLDSAALLWQAISQKAKSKKNRSISVVELSASGYKLVSINSKGKLKKDGIVVNPKCGAGSGVNMDRVLQKLAVEREEVDKILKDFTGVSGKNRRNGINIRADRCGVFSSSATISDKNQGIPLSFALATTLKSEVVKPCQKIDSKVDIVYLTGGIFNWRFARDCAKDYFKKLGVDKVIFDKDQRILAIGVISLINNIGINNFRKTNKRLQKESKPKIFPSFNEIKRNFEKKDEYLRMKEGKINNDLLRREKEKGFYLAFDVGSTMAKFIITDESKEEIKYIKSYSNSGDTIETIKKIFRDIKEQGFNRIRIVKIGITGSARYQVKQALEKIYPALSGRIEALVENYAHARGSINYVREHIDYLKKKGYKDVNEDFAVLIDIGGEDTKISTIAVQKEELYDNAMNVKCSAGTGSLMDTLTAMFGMNDIKNACDKAFGAKKAFEINATCAVFLMENARKLQAEGYPIDEILASANWAIIENMARTLWSQVDLPKNAVILLHGQTMLSEPLPLAAAYRMRSFVRGRNFCLIPPHPGHRACVGLVKSLRKKARQTAIEIELNEFIKKKFDKRIIQCFGAVCGDKNARCNRTLLSFKDKKDEISSFALGGCSAINEIRADRYKKQGVKNTYKEIWEFIDRQMPKDRKSVV